MNKPRSYATFKDGHEEDILYIEDRDDLGVLFATKSGIYRFCPDRDEIRGTSWVREPNHFERVHLDANKPADDISFITIDRKVSYDYMISKDGVYIFGEILASPDACDEDIKDLIMDELSIEIQKK